MIRPPLRSLYTSSVLVLAACASGDPVVDKDTGLDTDSDAPVDTDVEVETDPETDVETETDGAVDEVTVRQLRLNTGSTAIPTGSLVRLRGVVVTAVRIGTSANGFTVQDPSELDFGGLYVSTGASNDLPSVGQILTVTGVYREDPVGQISAPAPSQTLTVLDVLASAEGTSWEVTGAGGEVPEIVRSTSRIASMAEAYESMRLTLQQPGRLQVASQLTSTGTFSVRPVSGGTAITVGSQFHDIRLERPSLGPGDLLDAVDGVLLWRAGGYSLHPTEAADLRGYTPIGSGGDTDIPVDTDVPVDTDTPIDTDTPVDTDTPDDTFLQAETDETFFAGDTDTDSLVAHTDTDLTFDTDTDTDTAVTVDPCIATFEFVGDIPTVSNTPFGLPATVLRNTPVIGSFSYSICENDLDTRPEVGRYEYNGASDVRVVFTAVGVVVTGSGRAVVDVENFSPPDVFRFRDGQQIGSAVQRYMRRNGAQDPSVKLTFAIVDSTGAALTSQDAPSVFPFLSPGTQSHTFAVEDARGTALIQLSSITQTVFPQ